MSNETGHSIAALSLRPQRTAAPLREQVLAKLRTAIVEQHLKPGDRLIERQLIELTGVSRTTIREVMRELAAEGLVKTIPNKGAIVAIPTADEAIALYEVRGVLEGLAGRKFAERASDEQVVALRRTGEAILKLTDDGAAVPDLLRAKNDFYDVLLEGAGNSAVCSILRGLQARVSLLRVISLSRDGRPVASAGEIRAILDAIDARDPDAAERACVRHVSDAAQAALAALAAAPELLGR